jgi:hypothetical protein
VSDDFFGTPSAPPHSPPIMTPPGWSPPAGAVPPQQSVTFAQSSLAAIAVAVAGLITCLGAWGPWLHASGGGLGFDYGGLHSELNGKWVLGVGLIGLVLGVVLYTLPSGHDLRRAVSIAVIVLGVIGLIVVVRQYVKLSDAVSEINGPLGAFLGIHVQSGWGLWLAGFGCAGLGVTGFFSLVL